MSMVSKYEIPSISRMLEDLSAYSIFSELDVAQAFNQLENTDETKKLLSFTFQKKQYQFEGAAFGVQQLPQQYQLIMSNLLKDVKNVHVYVDNIIIGSSTIEEHLETVEKVIKILTDNNITLNKKKCHFLRSRINTLGFALSHNQVKISDSKLKKLDLLVPKSPKDLHSVLGFTNYLRNSVVHYSDFTKNLEFFKQRSQEEFDKNKELILKDWKNLCVVI
jgi:hypothetical protein